MRKVFHIGNKSIVYYNVYQVTDDGYNLLLDMKDEVPEKYAEIFKKVKDL